MPDPDTPVTQTNFASVMKQALHSPESAQSLRDYLLAGSPQQANNAATRFWESTKRFGNAAWDLRGPIGKHFVGLENYPQNFGVSGQAIRTQIQPEQQQ